MRKYQVSLDLRTNHERQLRGFEDSVNKAEESLKTLSSGFPNPFASATSGATTFLKRLGPLGGGLGVVVAGMGAATAAGAAFTRQYSIAAERSTVAEEALFDLNAELQLLAEGADLDDLQEAILNISERFGEATRDAGAIRDAMLSIGLSQQDIIDLNFDGPEAQLEAIREQFQGIATDSERIFRARELFAEDGLRILNLITAEADELQAIQARNDSIGISVDQEIFDDFRALRLETSVTTRAVQAFAINLGGAFAPDFTSLFTGLNDTIALFGGAESAALSIGTALQPISSIVSLIGKGIFFFGTAFRDAKGAAEDFFDIFPDADTVVESTVPQALLDRTRAFGDRLREVQSGTNLKIQRRYFEGQLDIAEASGAATEKLEEFRNILAIIEDGLAEGGRTAVQARADINTFQAGLENTANTADELDTAFAKLLDNVARIQQSADLKLEPEISGFAKAQADLEALEAAQAKLNATTGIDGEERTNSQAAIDAATDAAQQVLAIERKKSQNIIDNITNNDTERLRVQTEFDKKRAELNKQQLDTQLLDYEDYNNRLATLDAQEEAALARIDAKRAESSRKNQERLEKESLALERFRADLLGQVNQFGAIDNALSAQIDKIQEGLSRGAITTGEAEQLTIVAELEAQVNRDQLSTELQVLSRTAEDVSQINIPIALTGGSDVAGEVGRILDQIETDRAEVEENFQRTFRIDPAAAQSLRDALEADIDVQGAEALQRVLQSLDGLEIVPDVNILDGLNDELAAIEAPIRELEARINTAINGGDLETARVLELQIETIRDQGLQDIQKAVAEGYNIDLTVNTTGDGFDAASLDSLEGLRGLQEQLEAAGTRFSDIGGEGSLDAAFDEVANLDAELNRFLQDNPEADLSKFESQIKSLADTIKDELTGIFDSIDFGGSQISGFIQNLPAFQNLSPQVQALAGAGLEAAEGLFTDFYSQRAERENQAFQDSLSRFQAAETEKSAFAQAEEQFRQAEDSNDIASATDNLNSLLNQYQVTNDELIQLGLDRSSSAQQIANVIAQARAGETDSLRRQAVAQESAAKKAFETDKQFKRAQVIASGIQAVMNAYASAPPPFNVGLAAIAGAFAGKQLSAINSLSFGGSGGALASASAGGGIANIGSPSSPVGQIDSANDAIDGTNGVGGRVIVELEGRSSITREELIQIANAQEEARQEGLDILITD